MDGPTDAATYERARRVANFAMWTVALQRRRLKAWEPEDADFLFRRWADFQFLIMALTRLRRAAVLAAKVPAIAREIGAAVAEFDAALPMLKRMRNVAEHFDDYALDDGRLSDVDRKSLEVAVVGNTIFQWLGAELNADAAWHASVRLFEGIKEAKFILVATEEPCNANQV